jgi:hypothetical protein
VTLSYLDSSGYVTGLDRFGRVHKQVWTVYADDGQLGHPATRNSQFSSLPLRIQPLGPIFPIDITNHPAILVDV